jgi:hypothetical protein
MKRALIDIIPTCEDVPAAIYQYFAVDIPYAKTLYPTVIPEVC